MILLNIYLFIFFAIVLFSIISVIRVIFFWETPPVKQTYKDMAEVFFVTFVLALLWPVVFVIWLIGGFIYMTGGLRPIRRSLKSFTGKIFRTIGRRLHIGVMWIRKRLGKDKDNAN